MDELQTLFVHYCTKTFQITYINYKTNLLINKYHLNK